MASTADCTLSVRLRTDEQLQKTAAGQTALDLVPPTHLRGMEPVLELMQEFVTIHDLEGIVAQDDPRRLVSVHLLLHTLARLGVLEMASSPDRPVMMLRPMTPEFVLDLRPIADADVYRLSRFSYVRRDETGHMLMESPRGGARIEMLSPEASGIVFDLAEGVSTTDLAGRPGREPNGKLPEMRAVLALLRMGSIVDLCDDKGEMEEDASVPLRQWEFHDLLFHSRSRGGHHNYPMGGLYRFKGRIDPLPVVKPLNPERALVPLPRPVAIRGDDDPALSVVMESRRSIRQHGAFPITIGQLGEFLFRVARVRTLVPTAMGELTSRPYPNGGASYELEIYLTVHRCAGLAPGFYHYEPAVHALSLVSSPNEDWGQLLLDASRASAMTIPPQVVITLASRFQRVSWKYSGIAYATQLKNAGALYSTMYLVATAMNLAPCGLGLGNSARFCRLAQTSPYEESSIGEFMLGSRSVEAIS